MFNYLSLKLNIIRNIEGSIYRNCMMYKTETYWFFILYLSRVHNYYLIVEKLG